MGRFPDKRGGAAGLLLAGCVLWMGLTPQVRAPFRFHKGQTVAVVGLDMTSGQPRYWKPDLVIEQRAAAQFRHEKLFRVIARPANADFVFEIVLDIQSSDDAEAGAALTPAAYQNGRLTLDQLRDRSLWFGLSDPRRTWGPFAWTSRRSERGDYAGRGADRRGGWLWIKHSSARNLVAQFCLATGLKR